MKSEFLDIKYILKAIRLSILKVKSAQSDVLKKSSLRTFLLFTFFRNEAELLQSYY